MNSSCAPATRMAPSRANSSMSRSPKDRSRALPTARVRQRLGDLKDQRNISLIAIHEHGIPTHFPDAALAETSALRNFDPSGRERSAPVPLITIDPPDARDHDDAVWAEPDDDPANPGGVKVIVAIADVAAYVPSRHGARPRGAHSRQFGLFPRPRRADAARAHIERSLLAAREARIAPALACFMIFDRVGTQEEPSLYARRHALGRQAFL